MVTTSMYSRNELRLGGQGIGKLHHLLLFVGFYMDFPTSEKNSVNTTAIFLTCEHPRYAAIRGPTRRQAGWVQLLPALT